MARLRSNARQLSRHSGDQFDSGYQYRNPDTFSFRFGPWDRVSPFGRRDIPRTALASLTDSVLIDGMLFPAWARYTTTHTNQRVLGAFEFQLIDDIIRVIFYREGGKLHIEYMSQAISGTFATGLAITTDEITATAWQNTIYFGHSSLANVYSFTPLAPATTAVVNSPPNVEWLYVLDDNLVGIYKSGASYVVRWAVDSAPTNWTGYGSGSVVVSGKIGTVKGVAVTDRGAYIVGAQNAVLMSSTFSIPPFRFEDVPGFEGTPYKNAMATFNDTIFFVNYERRLTAYRGGETKEVGLGEDRFKAAPRIKYLRRLNVISVSSASPAQTLFLDPESMQWVSNIDEHWAFATSSPSAAEIGQVIGITANADTGHTRTILDLGASTVTMPEFLTGLTQLSGQRWIHYVDIVHTDTLQYVPLLRITRVLEDGTILLTEYNADRLADIRVVGQRARFWVEAPASAIELRSLTPRPENGGFDLDATNLAGNIPFHTINYFGSYRADLNAAGNFVVSTTSVGYGAAGLSAGGNMMLTLDINLWPANIGIDYIEVVARGVSNEQINPTG